MKISGIFAKHWEKFAACCGFMLAAVHHRAARAIELCRTAALGGQVYECSDCEEEKFAYHSCNHRNCPQCGGMDQKDWAAAQEAKLLPVPYFMITVTVPEQLRNFMYKEQTWAYDMFFEAVGSVMKDLGHDAKYLGGTTGYTAVLHTWTREMLYHPHIHVIIPGVALSGDGLRIYRAKAKKWLYPKAVLNVVFRNRIRKLIARRDAKLKSNELKEIDPSVWAKPWCINAKAVGAGDKALKYLARYVNKTAVTEQRLLGTTKDGKIILNCQNSKTGQWQEIHLMPHEFLRRWSLHVLPKGLVRVRHFGFLSAAGKKKRERITTLLGPRKTTIPLPEPCAETADETPAETVPSKTERKLNPPCPCCGKEMIWREELKRRDLWIAPPKECEMEKPPKKPKWKPTRARPPNKKKAKLKLVEETV